MVEGRESKDQVREFHLNVMKKEKRVTFDGRSAKVIPTAQHQVERTKDELKSMWYSRKELMESCSEAREIVKKILSVNGNMEAIDHSQVCVVGLEKFHGKKEREKHRKLLISSVLIRQEINRGLGLEQDNDCLRDLSQVISSSFKEFALWQAAMHKFHAYGHPNEIEVPSSERHSRVNSQSKKQKLERVSSSFKI